MIRELTRCLACGNSNLFPIIDFGETPLADALIRKEDLDKPELLAELKLVFCPACALVLITQVVSPEILFCRNYPYYSSVSPSLLQHFRDSAYRIIASRNLDSSNLVIEAASNDGYMLRTFSDAGIQVMGIDPAEGPATIAQRRGICTLKTFFCRSLAQELARYGKRADVFLANNVLAHVPDLNGFVDGIRIVLKDTGIAVIEVPYVVDLVDHVEFDTIYHQHLCYFSVTALDNLFRRHSLFLNELERTAIHGGSLRLFVELRENVGQSVSDVLAFERERKVNGLEFYQDFVAKAQNVRDELRKMLSILKSAGSSIAGYGAAAKATTMMAYAGIDRSHLDFIADLSPVKHNKYMGGNRIPIVPPSEIMERMPDYVLILAWNFGREIMQQLRKYAEQGGKFIIPLPEPTVVEYDEVTKDFAQKADNRT
ncbi:MAG: class I SAM-dependent methyltransferase [Bacteroidetes bacterium]|nr:class I SAM-dependent methyltransferase [Bacteroidota bacterium]MCW5897209.1 class I SAM-dependent methyltransferase [Bacteroidota bacterium]